MGTNPIIAAAAIDRAKAVTASAAALAEPVRTVRELSLMLEIVRGGEGDCARGASVGGRVMSSSARFSVGGLIVDGRFIVDSGLIRGCVSTGPFVVREDGIVWGIIVGE